MRSFLRKAHYSTSQTGAEFTKRIFVLGKDGKPLSPWNDIPLKPENSDANVFNAIIEIPRYTLGKLEVKKGEVNHPIGQDTRKNKQDPTKIELRYYAQHGFFNYGAFPQTWENPLIPNKEVGNLIGDNDPIDICEISDKSFASGSVVPVRVYGIFALIDEGELDWKVVCLNKEEADANNIKTLDDLEKYYPLRMKELIRWYKYYKTFDGKKANSIYFDEKILSMDRSIEVVHETYRAWQELYGCLKTPEKFNTEIGKQILNFAKEFHMPK